MSTTEYRHTKQWPYHISAGGAPYMKEGDQIKIALVVSKKDGNSYYNLPKGTLHHNETLEGCAIREVKEESGCDTEVTGLLGGLNRLYHDAYDGILTDKTTIYFALKIINISPIHDLEYDLVEFLDIDEAIYKLQSTRPEKEEYKIVSRLKEFLQK